MKAMLEEAEGKHFSLWQLVRNILQGYTKAHLRVAKAAENGLGAFSSLIISCRNRLLDPINPASPEDLLRYLIKRLDFKSYLERTYPEDQESRWANVEELVAQASEYRINSCVEFDGDTTILSDSEDALPIIEGLDQHRANVAEERLSRLLANIALATELHHKDDDSDDQEQQSQVTITTMHSAKGLEWPVVFVPSAYDGCIPHSRAEDTDEERRLLYVAMTRAQTLLYMSCPTKNSQREEATLSPFLSDRKVQHLLSNRGPVIDTGAVVDIARTLRRRCPSEDEMVQARQALRHWEDDLWPLDGSERGDAEKSQHGKWDQGDADGTIGLQPKRHKMTNKSNMKPLDTYTSLNIGITTTKENSSVFSCNGGIGFMPASKHLHDMHQQDDRKCHGESKKIKKTKKSISEKTSSEQGSLLNIWDETSPFEKTQDTSQLMLPRNEAAQNLLNASQSIKKDERGRKQTSNERLPLSSISQSLSVHCFQPSISSSRPLGIPKDHASSSNTYVFLSSSPPQIDEAPELDHIDSENNTSENVSSHSILLQHKEKNEPAKTFHNTSMAQVRANLPRKTLGLRRSVTSWNPGGRKRFNAPKTSYRDS